MAKKRKEKKGKEEKLFQNLLRTLIQYMSGRGYEPESSEDSSSRSSP